MKDCCEACGGALTPSTEFPDYPFGHHPMTIYYECPDCGTMWEDVWCSAVDGECPHCPARNISPTGWYAHDGKED
jgi:hypothetical protein